MHIQKLKLTVSWETYGVVFFNYEGWYYNYIRFWLHYISTIQLTRLSSC
jgi:hypothetical protein